MKNLVHFKHYVKYIFLLIWYKIRDILHGIPNPPAEHIDWTKETEPQKLSNVKTTDVFDGFSPIEREIELYKEKQNENKKLS